MKTKKQPAAQVVISDTSITAQQSATNEHTRAAVEALAAAAAANAKAIEQIAKGLQPAEGVNTYGIYIDGGRK